MKYIHTFWSKPLLENKFDKYDTSLKCILSNYALSTECLKQLNRKIILYTDSYGKDLLSFIGYDDIIVIDELENESIHFAAQIKFEALKRCELGDVIIDGDLFIRTKEALSIIENNTDDLLYSFMEPWYYLSQSNNLSQFCALYYIMDSVTYNEPYKLPQCYNSTGWYNTSLMRINNQELKDKYIKQYYYHKDLLKEKDFTNYKGLFLWPDIIIEQYFLRLLCETNNYSASPVINNYPNKESNDYALKIGYTHLGSLKSQFQKSIDGILKKLNIGLYNKYINQYNSYSLNSIKF